VIVRFRYQNISSLVIFVMDCHGDGDETRLDRVRLVGNGGMVEKTGQESTLEPSQVSPKAKSSRTIDRERAKARLLAMQLT
jgi:hypothetical protein